MEHPVSPGHTARKRHVTVKNGAPARQAGAWSAALINVV
jgi:hypothetical protein